MRLESMALTLLATLTDDAASRINPLDFTALLYLRDQGYAAVSIRDGCVVAERTPAGRQFAHERAGGNAGLRYHVGPGLPGNTALPGDGRNAVSSHEIPGIFDARGSQSIAPHRKERRAAALREKWLYIRRKYAGRTRKRP